MATPELSSARNESVIKHRAEEFLVPEEIQNIGVHPVGHTPKMLNDHNGNQLVSPVVSHPTDSRVFPVDARSEAEIKEMSKGSFSDSSKWNSFVLMRQIKKALLKGFSIVFQKA